MVHDNFDAIQQDRYAATKKLDVQGLPLIGSTGRVYTRRDKTVYAANAQRIDRLVTIVLNLDFVATAEVDAAVAAFGIAKFQLQLEVVVLRFA